MSSSSLKGEFSLDDDDDEIDDGHGTKLVVQTWLKTYNITLMAQVMMIKEIFIITHLHD